MDEGATPEGEVTADGYEQEDTEDGEEQYMTMLEDEIQVKAEAAEQGDEEAETALAALSECLVAEQHAYMARRELKMLKSGKGDGKGKPGRGRGDAGKG